MPIQSVLMAALAWGTPSARPRARAPRLAADEPPFRLLVVGGSGFLGREVCREAVERGWSVTSLSRRGENPCPGSALDAVRWTAGDASDAALLGELSAQNDGFVHAVGMLLDDDSGLGWANPITSGSRSKVSAGATYDSVMRETALALLAAARASASGTRRPFAYVSASEAGWADLDAGRWLEAKVAPSWLGRYLAAKRAVEAALSSPEESSAVRPILARPSLMYNYGKLDVLPLLPVWNALAALRIGSGAFGKMLRVELVGASIVQVRIGSAHGLLFRRLLAPTHAHRRSQTHPSRAPSRRPISSRSRRRGRHSGYVRSTRSPLASRPSRGCRLAPTSRLNWRRAAIPARPSYLRS